VFIVPLFFFIFLAANTVQAMGPVWMVALALLLGSIGIAGVGTLLATMSVNTKGKDFILAVLFIPLMFPLLLAVVAGTSAVLQAEMGYVQTFWQMMGLAAGYDTIMLLVAFALYEFVLGA
jgi:heme exporter protein B